MQYREFGSTGFKISALGFGAMRLPEYEKNGKWHINEDECLEVIHHAFDLGVNYIDTAIMYCHENSQYIVGKAIKGYRDMVRVSTKLATGRVNSEDDFWRCLDESMKRLDVDCIDFYHIHGLNKNVMENKVYKHNLLDCLEKAKQKGLIAHKSFSFHDKPEEMIRFIDTGAFDSVLCQYNLLDRSNEKALAYARSKGLGTVTMGPVAGGRLAVTSEVLKELVGNASGTPEIALRFVLANSNVNCALSGMSTIQMVDENVATASRVDEISSGEWAIIGDTLEQMKAMSDLYCTGCDYCQPCPKGINISRLFTTYNYHKIYGITEFAKKEFARHGKDEKFGSDPRECVKCGECTEKCPQNIDIPEKIHMAIEELS